MKPKFCIVSYRFPPEYSGAGKRAAEFAEYLYNSGYHVTVITSKAPTFKKKTHYKFDIFYYKRNNFRFTIRILFESIDLLIKLYIHRKYYDYLIIYGGPTLAASLMSLLKTNVITVYRSTIVNDDDFPSLFTNRHLGWFYRITFRMIDYHWIISEEMRGGLTKIGVPETKIIYSPNGIMLQDVGDARTLNRKKIQKDDEINFLFIGEISHRKGVDLIIELFPKILKHYPSSHLNICGPIGNQDLYQKLLELPNTKYYGIVDNIYNLLDKNDFFLFPSRKEGFPTAVIEAMSRGLVCITSKLPVIENEIIDNSVDGYCIDFQDPKNFIQVISCLLKNNDLRYAVSENAINKVKSKFITSNNFVKIIEKLLK